MKPGIYDIEVFEGSTFDIPLTAENLISKMSIDFSTYTSAELEVRPSWHFDKSQPRPEPLLKMTSEAGQIIIAADAVTLHLTAIETLALDFTSGKYRFKLMKLINEGEVDEELIIDPWLKGSFTVVPED